MSRPYSDYDLVEQITADRNWRIKEIADLDTLIERAEGKFQQVLLRSMVPISYAHWEGSVRFAANKYLDHIALRKFPYKKLDRQFLKNAFLPRLNALSQSKSSIGERCSLVDQILEAQTVRFSRVNEELVNTRANLNSDVISDICVVCGLSPDLFSEKSSFIDIVLLKRRNAIAHGEDTLIGLDDLASITKETIELMRTFGNAIENSAVMKTYMAA